MATQLRHTQFSEDLTELRGQLGDNARDTNQGLSERVLGRHVRVGAYSATGATTSKITLTVQGLVMPVGVLLIRAYQTNDPGSDVSVSGRVNFTQQGENLNIFEPAGLTAYTLYDLTFLVVEGG